MILGWAAAAWAGTLWVVPEQGEIHPLTPTMLEVAAVDNLGEPIAPEVAVSAGKLRIHDRAETPGVVEMEFTPPAQPGEVRFSMVGVGDATVMVTPNEPSRLVVPGRVEAVSGEREVVVHVDGDLPMSALQWSLSEGAVISVAEARGGLDVRIALSDAVNPRLVPVAFWDGRRDELPAWTVIRVRGRTSVDIETEPGAKVSLAIGKRVYGPFVADSKGMVRPVLEQYPGESSAQVTLVDDLGNETRTTLSLPPTGRGVLFAFAAGSLQPWASPPPVYALVLGPDGAAWAQAPLECQTAAASEVLLLPVSSGFWQVTAVTARSDQDLRIRCGAGDLSSNLRLSVDARVPTAIDVRVWPAELSSEFPIAEFQATLQNSVGDRLPPKGLSVRATHGQLVFDDLEGVVVRGEFNASKAVASGEDQLSARYDAPPSELGVPHQVQALGWLDREGDARLSARVVDEVSHPIVGMNVHFSVGERRVEAATGVDGWAVAQVDVEPGFTPMVLVVGADQRVARALLIRDQRPKLGPGTADLEVIRTVPIRTGRVQRVDLLVEPAILYTGPQAIARVRAYVRDSSGALIADPPESAEVSKGTLGPWVPAEDGGWVAEYQPPNGDTAHMVVVNVRAESASSSATLQLEPRPIDRSAMFSVGVMSNFGAILSPYVAADLDWRSPLLKRKILIRFGLAYFGDQTEIATGLESGARLRTTLFPMNLTAMARTDLRGNGLWGGIGVVVAPYISEGRFGSDTYTQLRIYPPGLQVLGGVGRRLGVGELVFELRGVALTSTGGEFGFSGPVGGLGAVLGYRVVY